MLNSSAERSISLIAWDATTSDLPSHEGTHGCEEHVQLMRHASYKVAVTDHADTKEDTKDNFTEVLWRVPSADWKPTGVSIKPREENQLVIHWWRRSDSAWLRESVKRLRLKDLPNDSSGGATAPGGDMAPRSWQPRMELGHASGSSPNRQMESFGIRCSCCAEPQPA